MTTRVINVFANLQTEFEEAQKGLKDVDDSIKKITGRDPGSTKPKTQTTNRNRLVSNLLISSNLIKNEQSQSQIEEPQRKRRRYDSNNRFDEKDKAQDDDDQIPKPTLQSSVIATPKEVKPRTQALEEQKSDKRGMARNKRMFGMILGTLQKFQSEESRRKDTLQKRVEIEKKLDAAAEEEKEAIKKERKELFLIRREKQAQIRRIEHKMERVEIHQEWEKSYHYFGNFIQTRTKPHLFYLPAKHTPETEKKLQESRDKFRLIVAEKRAKVQKELAEIDESYKKNETVNKSERHITDDEIINNEEIEELIKDKDDLNHSFVSVNSLNDSFYKKIATQNLGLSPYSTQVKCQEKDNESIYKNLIMNKAQNDFGSQELLGLCSGDFETPTKFIEETKNDKNIVDDEDDDFLNTGKSFKNIKKFTLESDDENDEKEDKNKDENEDKNKDENEDKNENKDENEDEKVKVESQVNDKDYEDEDEDEVEADDDEREEDMESEEDEEIVDAKGFLDVEAELSGSEASADEDEDEEIDGPFEEAAEAEDLPSEDDLREQIGRLHHRQLMDQDKREVLLMQEMMFEDGDMHDDGRQREKKFRWQNLDNSEWQNIYNDYQSDSGESDGGEEEIKRPQLKIQYDDDDNDNNDNDSKDRISEETNSKKDIITSQMNYNTKKVNLSDFIIRDERLKNVLSIKRPSPLKPRRKAKKFKSQQQQQSVFDLF